jgi:rare lipoprotein A
MLLGLIVGTAMPFFHLDAALCGETGIASYYSAVPDPSQPLTAAHRHLPLGTYVRVTRLDTGTPLVVRVNDRGPFLKGRIIDLSRGAAARLGMLDAGIVRVSVEVVSLPALTAELHYHAFTRCAPCVEPLLLE